MRRSERPRVGAKRAAIAACLALGAALRIREYADRRSVTLDESFLAVNLSWHSFRQLLRSLDFNQAAPLGFLELEKSAIAVLGNDEYVLRLLPFVASLVSLALFPLVAERLVGETAAVAGLAAFAVADPLVFYAGLGKQYSVDVMVTLALLAIVPGGRRSRIAPLAAAGALAVWLSHPAIFVLATIGIVEVVSALRHGVRQDALTWCAVGVLWLSSFGVAYAVSLENLSRLESTLPNRGVLLPNAGASTGGSGLTSIVRKARYLVGLEDTFSGAPAIHASGPVPVNDALTVGLLLVTALGVVRTWRSNPVALALLGGPAAFAAAASALGRYPLLGRTLLFVIPALCMFLGAGVAALLAFGRRRRWALVPAVPLLILAPLFVLPLRHALHPPDSGVRPALAALDARRKPGDVIYVYYPAHYAFAYYDACRCASRGVFDQWAPRRGPGGTAQWAPALVSDPPRLVLSKRGAEDDPAADANDLRQFRGRSRVWLLLPMASEETRGAIVAGARRLGKEIESDSRDREHTPSLYLFDFRRR